MLISKQMNAALNTQVGNELLASNQYVQIAAYFDAEGLPILAKHYFNQAAEERDHAMRFVRLILDGGGDVKIPQVPAPKPSFKTAMEAVQLALDSELKVTAQINDIVDLAVKERDHIMKNGLDWFVNEQREEVTSADTLVRMVKRAGEAGLFHVEAFLRDGGLSEEGDAGAAG
ncbi:MAG: ferritin [Gemmatimonadaceae bacterium]|nr:ferritin [Gemmatimonadaceae bacterium]